MMADFNLKPLFVELVEGNSPGCIGARLGGTKPSNPDAVAWVAHVLGALAPIEKMWFV